MTTNKVLDDLYETAKKMIEKNKDYSESNIEKAIKLIVQFNNYKVDEDSINFVLRKIHTDIGITLDKGSFIEDSVQPFKSWFMDSKAEIDFKYWGKYRDMLLDKPGFNEDIVNTLDDSLDSLTDLLGNPNLNTEFIRRGLVIGDVQSGKTSNFIGLICKAADAGFKVIIVLTGTIEKLRAQTQERLNQVFIPQTNDSTSHAPVLLTNVEQDFKRSSANAHIRIDSLKEPMILCIKKNVTVLKNLHQWLKKINQNQEGLIDTSLLLIDDEADNASVNTNDPENDPTKTNKYIRDILALFNRQSYIGYTATPYANIFIDPDTDENMETQDLFPRDFLYVLDPPSNYIGARNIFTEDWEKKNILKEIDTEKIELLIPLKHKKDLADSLYSIPRDMMEAIEAFLIANAIRDIREPDYKSHRSMLINVSRFTNVQAELSKIVNKYLKNVQDKIKLYSKLSEEEFLKEPLIQNLYNTYMKLYIDSGISWYQIQDKLNQAVAPIKVYTINQKSDDKIDYSLSDGVRAIAIGGLSLSRGLTLEGLMVSYFYRNSKAYDTLMQMGRWFGYRQGYEDLCKIYMSRDSIEWYQYISEASDELRDDIKRYQGTAMTPIKFGLRIRNDVNALIVTAHNKMRSAEDQSRKVSLSSEFVETTFISSDLEKNIENYNVVKDLVNEIENSGIELYTNIRSKGETRYGYRDVPISIILEFLSRYEDSKYDLAFDTVQLKKFIERYSGSELNNWDVAFIPGHSKRVACLGSFKYPMVSRKVVQVENDQVVKVSGNKKRLGSSGDGSFGITDFEISKIKEDILSKIKRTSLTQKEYFSTANRNPLLAIYLIDSTITSDNKEFEEQFKRDYSTQPLVGISLGFPKLSESESKMISFKVNKIWLKREMEEGEEDE